MWCAEPRASCQLDKLGESNNNSTLSGDAFPPQKDGDLEPKFNQELQDRFLEAVEAKKELSDAMRKRFRDVSAERSHAAAMKALQINVMERQESAEEDWFLQVRWRLARIMDSFEMKLLVTSVIVINAIFLGIEADYRDEDDTDTAWDTAELAFVVFFVIEMLCSVTAFGWLFFTNSYNILDFSIVVIAVVDFFLTKAGGLSVIRLVRLFRIFRIVRVFTAFRQLRILVQVFISSMGSIVYVLAMMIIALYAFGVLATNLFGDWPSLQLELDQYQVLQYDGVSSSFAVPFKGLTPPNSDRLTLTTLMQVQYGILVDLELLFGSVSKSMVTLMALATYDAGTVEVMRPIGLKRPMTWFFFGIFMVTVAVGMLELLTAVFVDTLAVERMKEKSLQKEAEKDYFVSATELMADMLKVNNNA